MQTLYGIPVWYKQKYVDSIESVHRRATKQVLGMRDKSYVERLNRVETAYISI